MTIVLSPCCDSANVTSVPIHSSGPAVNRQVISSLVDFDIVNFALPISSPAFERNTTRTVPPGVDSPEVSSVHQPAIPATVESAACTFEMGALIPIL